MKHMEKETREILLQCKLGKNSIAAPQIDKVELRTAVFEKLESIGGTWKGGRSNEFDFKEDPAAAWRKLIADHSDIADETLCTKCKDKLTTAEKMTVFPYTEDEVICDACNAALVKSETAAEAPFESTPDLLADKMVKLAEIDMSNTVADPCAGKGNIAKAINRIKKVDTVFCYELDPANHKRLKKVPNVGFVRADFLDPSYPWEHFDKIIAHPPLSENHDIYLIHEMYQRLEKGGRIVTLAGKDWQTAKSYPAAHFRVWLVEIGAKVIEVPAEELVEIECTTPFVIIVINK